jgi:DNA-binding CsgD family transcriptional regulator/PAS domain-containing protein
MNPPTTPRPEGLLPEQYLLDLHAAIDTAALWRAMTALFDHAFRPHFSIAALRFMAAQPTVTLRTRPAPRRTAAWWRRNIAVHPGIEWLMHHPGAQIARVSDIMPLDELRRHPYYHAFIKPEGWLYSVGFFFWEGRELTAILGVNRAPDQADFTEDEMNLCRALYPHLQTALRRVALIESRLNAQQALARLILQLPQPTLLLDWDGRPVYHNHAAASLLARWAGRARPGAPVPADLLAAARKMREDMELRARANEPLPAVAAATITCPRDRALSATLEAIHLGAAPLTPPTFLVRFATGPSRTAALHRLTEREQELALLLCEGASNKELATTLGKSEHTVKNQLKAVFRKLGVRSRTHLAGLLSQS